MSYLDDLRNEIAAKRDEFVATHDLDDPLPEGTVWIWDNGEEYSDHALHFVDVGGLTPGDIFAIEERRGSFGWWIAEIAISESWHMELQTFDAWANSRQYVPPEKRAYEHEPSTQVKHRIYPAWIRSARASIKACERGAEYHKTRMAEGRSVDYHERSIAEAKTRAAQLARDIAAMEAELP